MGSTHTREENQSECNNNNDHVIYKEKYCFKPFVFETIDHGDALWPKPRSGHRTVSNKCNVYTYGGYNPDLSNDPDLRGDPDWTLSKPLFREVWKYNMAKSSWSKVPALNIPYILASNAVLLQGNMMLVYGGTGVPFGGHCSNTLYVCDLSENEPQFRKIETIGDIPEAQYGQAAFIQDKFLYTIGGTTGYDYSCDIHRLNLSTGTWEVVYLNKGLPCDPPGRYRHEIGLQPSKSKVFIFGGGSSLQSFGFEALPVFDLLNRQWDTVKTHGDPHVQENCGYPLPRRFHSLVQAPEGNDVYMTGGESGIFPLSDTWRFNLESLEWTRIDTLKLMLHRYFHAATLSPQGKMYLFGGINMATRTDEMLSVWLCIPKLQEICWEAILYYNLLDSFPKESLGEILPPNFLRRLD